MYVLMVTFRSTVLPSLLPATPGAFCSHGFDYEYMPVAVSQDVEHLREEAKGIRERFAGTYESHQILEVREV